jgi:TolB-like protein/Flp pilus assembly protein TadD
MQEDEGEALAQRDRHREILASVVERHLGEVLQDYGDGTLSIFASAVEAVECAVEVQLEVAKEPLIPLRIGVHTGDIVRDADGVYGDGVNVASRIEGLSAPGGVMVSGKVFDEIKNHSSISSVSIGLVRLKNVELRVNVFAISNEGLSVPSPDEIRRKTEPQDPDLLDPQETLAEDGTLFPPPPLGAGEAFLQRVKERALLQWALVYLAGAWVVLQVVGFASERLLWFALIQQGMALVAFIGLLVTLVVAWYHGEKGRQRVRPTEVLIISVLLAVTGGALTLLPPGNRDALSDQPKPYSSPPIADDRPSVAALPWINRSGLAEDSYFSDGIHDQILTQLAKIGGMRVISRQSVIQFRDSPLTAGEIANELGVRYILEGGLLRIRDTVRINVQLIDTQNNDLAWAATHDRHLTLENLLSLQTEVAQAIADTLRAAVTPRERVELERVGTDVLEAYDFYLQGRSYLLRPGYHQDDFEAAEALFQRAIALDPEFALARAALSRVHGLIFWERFDPSDDRLEAQRREAEAALSLQPDLPQAHLAVGWTHYVRGEFQEALEEYDAALDGLPNDAEIVALIGYTHRRLGNWTEVFRAFEEATRLNPRDATLFYDLGGHSFGVTHQYEDAVRAYDRAMTLAPDLYDAGLRKGYTYLHWRGQTDTLSLMIAQLPTNLHAPEIDLARVDLALWERDAEGLIRLLDATPVGAFETQLTYLPKPLYAAWAHRVRGDDSAARAAFDSARVVLEPLARENPADERVLAGLGFAYAGLGRSADAARSAWEFVESSERAGNVFSRIQSGEIFARILAQAGLAEEAVERLGGLLGGDSHISVHTLRLDPLYDPIRDTPPFRALLAGYGPGTLPD